jgi:hypothetical protein
MKIIKNLFSPTSMDEEDKRIHKTLFGLSAGVYLVLTVIIVIILN